MKKYIGTKSVEAEVMDELTAVGKGFARPNEDNHEWRQGYHVRYEEGYESWSPKEVFEKAYKIADTFLDRLHIEDAELTEKYEKCNAFVDSDKYREVVKEDYPAFLLYLQREAMGSYLGTLHNRIEYANGAKLKPNTEYNFGEAILALKFGLAIRRSGWGDKDLVIFKQVPAHVGGEIIPKMQSLPQKAKNLIINGINFIDYTNQCLVYNRKTGKADSWVPSISDVFADDWSIIIE